MLSEKLANRHVLRSNAESVDFISVGNEFRNANATMSGVIASTTMGNAEYLFNGVVAWNSDETRAEIRQFREARPGHATLVLFSYNTPIAMLSLTDGSYWLSRQNYSQTTGRHRSHFMNGIGRYRAKLGKKTAHQNERGAHN